MRKQERSKPVQIVVTENTDTEWMLERVKPLLSGLLPIPKRVTVKLPDSHTNAKDRIFVEIYEGDLTREYVYLHAEIGSGLPHENERFELSGSMRVDQIDRLICALQNAARAADRTGLLKRRALPTVAELRRELDEQRGAARRVSR